MSVSVEIFVGVQAVSGFCLLVALSHLTARGASTLWTAGALRPWSRRYDAAAAMLW